MPEPTVEVTYRGLDDGHSVNVVVCGDPPGTQRVSYLTHHSKHSPDGFSWGYGGSGPAELARCLLIDALGEQATCTTCEGRGKVAPDDALGNFRPALTGDDPAIVIGCIECDAGFGPAVERAYQSFKFEVVATWPMSKPWTMSRDDVLAWHAAHTGAGASTRH